MHTLIQMDPKLYFAARRKQREVWTDLFDALGSGLGPARSPRWTVDVSISMEQVLEDLAYGRE